MHGHTDVKSTSVLASRGKLRSIALVKLWRSSGPVWPGKNINTRKITLRHKHKKQQRVKCIKYCAPWYCCCSNNWLYKTVVWTVQITLIFLHGATALSGSARRRDPYLTKHNIFKTHPCPPAEFEPAIPVSGRPQNYTLDRATTGIGYHLLV